MTKRPFSAFGSSLMLILAVAAATDGFVPASLRRHQSTFATTVRGGDGGSSSSSSSFDTRLHATNDSTFAVIVQAEVEPDRMDEFLKMIETNAVESRKEPGCLRFDVLRAQDRPNLFFFYELYKNQDAVEHHKQQSHYLAWSTFKESGGVIKSLSYKTDGEFVS